MILKDPTVWTMYGQIAIIGGPALLVEIMLFSVLVGISQALRNDHSEAERWFLTAAATVAIAVVVNIITLVISILYSLSH